MSLDSLNAQAKNTEASEGYVPHPLGSFEGVIDEITQKEINDRPCYALAISTSQGVGQYTIWGFSESDLANFETDSELKEKMLKSVGRAKGVFKTLGLEIPAVWSGDKNSVIERLQELVGKKCRLVVKQNQYKPETTVSFLNKSTDRPDQITGPAPMRQSASSNNTQVNNSPQTDIGAGGFDSIPF
jgi:hypothetical protein